MRSPNCILESERSLHIRHALILLALLGVFAIAALAHHRATAPKAFRGVLRYPVMNIGGEGSSAKLVTPNGTFDLFFAKEGKHNTHSRTEGPATLLQASCNRRVVVLGFSLTARGVERDEYPAIRVITIALDPPSTANAP